MLVIVCGRTDKVDWSKDRGVIVSTTWPEANQGHLQRNQIEYSVINCRQLNQRHWMNTWFLCLELIVDDCWPRDLVFRKLSFLTYLRIFKISTHPCRPRWRSSHFPWYHWRPAAPQDEYGPDTQDWSFCCVYVILSQIALNSVNRAAPNQQWSVEPTPAISTH